MKDASRSNVVVLGQFDRRRVPPSPSATIVLNETKAMAATHLARALSQLMENGADELFDLAERSSNSEVRNLYMDSMALLRDKRDALASSFKTHFALAFDKQVRGTTSASARGVQADELSLMETDDLEESLAAANLANGIHGTCGEELFGIEKRMGALLNDPELDMGGNPLDPEVISTGFLEALKESGCSVKVKLVVVRLFSNSLPEQTRSVYRDINQFLVEKRVLPKIRSSIKKNTERSTATAPTPGADGSARDSHAAASGGHDLFATLQRLLSVGSAGASSGGTVAARGGDMAAAMAGMQAQGAAAEQNPEVFHALTKLQHGQLEGAIGANSGLSAASLSNGSINVLREIKASISASSMGHVDAMTLDIVAMLFDYILDDRRLPDAMKALIGRLQIPVLKVAMLDKAFFSQRHHPARKLLDTLAEASIGWNEAEGHEGGLYKTVDDLVQRILNEFDENVEIFPTVLEGFHQYLAEEKEAAIALTGRSAQVIHHQERAEIAQLVSHDEVRRRIQQHELPQPIRDFLTSRWKKALTAIYGKSGEDSHAWTTALETMDDLVWSVMPKQSPDERKRLVALLPTLLKRLQDGMSSAGMNQDERDEFFAKLVKCHSEAVKASLQSAAAASDVPHETPEQREAWFDAQKVDDGIPTLTDTVDTQGDFVEIPAAPESEAIEPELIEDITQAIDASPIGEEAVQELSLETTWQEHDELEGDAYDATVRQLKRGTWIEHEQEDGTMARAKLAWISPLKGLYLFTNRLGARGLVITPATLAAKLRNGQAHLIDNAALVDRAVDNLMDRLKTGAVPTE
jgi:hypothetical protein